MRRHVTIVHKTKDLHEVDYTQLYDFLKYNQAEVNELRVERLARAHDLLALMENSNNPYNYLVFHQDQPSSITYMQQPQPNNNFIPQPSFNTNYMQQPMPNPEDITDPTTAMNMALVLMAKAFKLNYSTPTNNNQRISSNPRNRQIAQPGMNLGRDRQMQMVRDNRGNQFRQYTGQNIGNQNGLMQYRLSRISHNLNSNGNGNVVAAQAEGNAIGNNDLDEIKEVNENSVLMANMQQASTSGNQIDKSPVYDSDGSAEVHEYDNCYNNEIFNMFTQEEQYIELLEPIPEPHQVQQNDSNVISVVSSTEQSGGTVEQNPATVEETRAYFESLYNNLAIEVKKVNKVNHKMNETNTELTAELARYKNQEKCFEINQEKYDKLERCYQKYVYQEQCHTKKINALHLSSTKTITTLNEEITNLNNQLSKENSTVSSLQEEKKKLKSDFKIHEDKLLDKQIQLENKIKELDHILVKMGQSIQTMHMLSPKPDSFYHTEQKMDLHDPPTVYDSEETLQLAQESRLKGQFLKEADKFDRDFKSLAKVADESLAKYKALEFKIVRLLRVVVSQDIMSIMQNTLDLLSQKLENENVELEFQIKNYAKEMFILRLPIRTFLTLLISQLFDKVSEQKHITKGTSVNTQFYKKSILGKPPSSSGSKLYSVTPFPKSKGLSKIDELHALSKPVTSNSIPTLQESKVMKNDNVITQGMFKINPFNTSREEKCVPNKPIKASVRTKPIAISQPHVITKKDVNSDSNGLSSTGVDVTTKTRRPQPRCNKKNDSVPSASISSCIKNKEVEVEEHHRNLLLSKNKKHMSFECNNVKLAIRNDKSDVVYAMCKQCLITVNHDVYVLNYVNGMNSRGYPNLFMFLGTVRFGNDHVAAILDLEVAFRRNSCFVRNLEGVDLLKGNHTTNLYTINLHKMASASTICLMARATSTKSWLWHQRLSRLNFDMINDLVKNDLVIGL
ncbi:integrase, catalytic region, zinc finger, CCHC-type containing protein [Tanacetum coccineum]|uniref:Integrase, catalytic region, zinc finger, CCHC-type containing protein n=1 Tax=Tanacetum coccineum TaxID=301880 RepID=A0ABQ5B695_9ASTR